MGTRWRIRKRTFAHVRTVEAGWPPAYALAAGTDGPVTLLTFRSPEPEVDALASAGHPYFRPRWGRDVLGMVLGSDVDWAELTELLVESYCELAPGKLVAMVDRPTG